jgi:hypothetical protein
MNVNTVWREMWQAESLAPVSDKFTLVVMTVCISCETLETSLKEKKVDQKKYTSYVRS